MEFDLDHIAGLANLQFDSAEKERIAAQMRRITEMVSHLPPAVQTDRLADAEPMLLREDTAAPSMERELLLQNAPQTENGCFSVPRVVESGGSRHEAP